MGNIHQKKKISVPHPPTNRKYDKLPSLKEKIQNFLKTPTDSLCLYADQQRSTSDYRQIIDACQGKKCVFIGSDADIHTSQDLFKSSDIIIIDYEKIFQKDALNAILESSNHKKVLGILSDYQYKSLPPSVQSRWKDSFEYYHTQKNRSSRTNSDIPPYAPKRHDQLERVYYHPNFSVELYLQKINLKSAAPVYFEGEVIDTPQLRFLQALLESKGKQIFFSKFPYPQFLHLQKHAPNSSKQCLIHMHNFESVKGTYYVEDNALKRTKPPQQVCVIGELSEEKWRYLGYLEQNHGLMITVLLSVHLPPPMILNLTAETRPTHAPETPKITWYICERHQHIESIYTQVKHTHPESTVIRLRVRPNDTLENFLAKIKKKDGHCFEYETSPLLQFFEDPQTIIFFENLDCNQSLKSELIELSLSQTFQKNGKKINIQAKILCVETKNIDTPFILKQKITSKRANLSKQTLLTQKNKTSIVANGLSEKSVFLRNFLSDPSQKTFILKGESGSGKTYLISEKVSELNMEQHVISCSQILTTRSIEKTVLDWLTNPNPASLIIDHYHTVQNGTWDFIIPDSDNTIYISGNAYVIPSTHRCIFVATNNPPASTHQFSKNLPKLIFQNYSLNDVLDISSTWIQDKSVLEWFQNFYLILNRDLHCTVTLWDLKRFCNSLHHFYNQSQNLNLAKGLSTGIFLANRLSKAALTNIWKVASLPKELWEHCLNSITPVSHPELSHDQCIIERLLAHFLTLYHTDKQAIQSEKPTFWIEGEAGSGKDFITDRVLKGYPHIRVKGSDLQRVLDQARLAKEQGIILIIEEADLVCMDILRNILDTTHAHAGFCVIATVNGRYYANRESVSDSVEKQIWRYNFGFISPEDLRRMIYSKFTNTLTASSIDEIVGWYSELTTLISPREVFVVIEEFLFTGKPLHLCWQQKIHFLKKIRPHLSPKQHPLNLRENRDETILKKIMNNDVSPTPFSIKKRTDPNRLEPPHSSSNIKDFLPATPSSISGIFKDTTSVVLQTTESFLPFEHTYENKFGEAFICSSKGSKSCPKGGQYYVELPSAFYVSMHDHSNPHILLPLPPNTTPIEIWIGKSKETLQIQDYDALISDKFGRFFISLEITPPPDCISLKVRYIASPTYEQPPPMPPPHSYHTCQFDLPSNIRSIINKKNDIDHESLLTELAFTFNKMTFTKNLDARSLYAHARQGTKLVQKCLDTQKGVCYEFARTFLAVVSSELNYPTRLVRGLYPVSHNKAEIHVKPEVFINGSWRTFEVTPANFEPRSNAHKSTIPKKLKSLIEQWCYHTKHTAPTTLATNLPTTHPEKTLCLDMYHLTSKELYLSKQIQPHSWKTDLTILLTSASNPYTSCTHSTHHLPQHPERRQVCPPQPKPSPKIHQIRSSNIVFNWLLTPVKHDITTIKTLLEKNTESTLLSNSQMMDFKPKLDTFIPFLLDLEIPVYIATRKGFLKVSTYQAIDWNTVVSQERVDVPSKFTVLDDMITSMQTKLGNLSLKTSATVMKNNKGAYNLEIKSTGELLKAIALFTEASTTTTAFNSYISTLTLSHLNEEDSEKIHQIIDLTKPINLILNNCPLPNFSTPLNTLIIKNNLITRSHCLRYLKTCPKIKNVELLFNGLVSLFIETP